MSDWKDITSYSRSDTDKTPKSWALKAGPFRLVVHRHIHYGPNQWLATCPGVFEHQELESEDADRAKLEAELLLRTLLVTSIGHLGKPA